MKKSILFTGGSGLLSLNWAIQIRDNYEVFLGLHEKEIHLSGTKSIKINLSSELNINKFLNDIKPDIVIHTAGITSVELCESNTEMAFFVNATIPGMLSTECNRKGIKFIHISTDHLFTGLIRFTKEETQVDPLNVYGKSKALGEEFVKTNNPNALVLRTNFFGWGTNYRSSFSDTIINTLRAKKEILLFDDVYYTPIIISQFVELANLLIEKSISGIINISSSERITKYNFGILLADKFGLNKNLIQKSNINDNQSLVIRPKDMSLSSQKVLELTNYNIMSIENQIDLLKKQELSGIASELRTITSNQN